MSDTKFTEEELRRMARTWFKEARDTSAQDDAEVTAWRQELNKTARNLYSGYGGYGLWSSSSTGSSDSDCGGGGSD